MEELDYTRDVEIVKKDAALEGGKQVTINDTSTNIISSNSARSSFTLIVRDDTNVFIELGATAADTSVELEPGDVLSSDDYIGVVAGIVAAGSGRVDVFEV